MEGGAWIIIGIIAWIVFRIYHRSKQTEKYNKAIEEFSKIGVLQNRAIKDKIEIGGKKREVFKIEAKGLWMLQGRSANRGYFVTYAFDQTDGMEMYTKSWPIRSTIETFAEENSSCLCLKGDVMDASPDTYYPEWAPIGGVPIELMDFPFKGKRKIAFITYFCDTNMVFKHGFPETKESILGLATSTTEVNVEDIGWKESLDNKPRIIELTIKLGVAVASADDEITQDEIDRIRIWTGKQVELDFYGDEEKIKERKVFYKKYLEDTVQFAEKNKLNEIEISEEMKSLATKQEKYDAIELMMDVMVSDTDAGSDEKAVIDKVSPLLGLDSNVVKDLHDTRLSKVKSIGGNTSGNKKGTSDNESLFGLTSTMSDKEKCEKLNEEYEVWHPKMELPDREVSKRAREMLDKIMDLRKKYKCK